MGQAIVKAKIEDIRNLIRAWSLENKLVVINEPPKIEASAQIDSGKPILFKSEDRLYGVVWGTATWECSRISADTLAINMCMYPTRYIMAIIDAVLILFSIIVTWQLYVFFEETTVYSGISICLFGLFTLLTLSGRLDITSVLAKVEKSFWEKVKTNFDFHQQTRSSGNAYSDHWSRVFYLFLSIFVLCDLFIVFQYAGVLIFLFACMPLMMMLFADSILNKNPHWHWHSWIVGNMFAWTIVAGHIMTLGFFLFALETYNSQKGYQFEGVERLKVMCDGIRNPEFRQILPFSAKTIEEDAMARLYTQAGFPISNISVIEEDQLSLMREDVRRSPVLISGLLLIYLLAEYYLTAFYFTYISSWRNEYCEKEMPYGPYVPYFPQAWKWKMSPLFRVICFLYFFLGGVVNWIAVSFCLEGLSFAFLGRFLFIEKFAYLWSWLFAVAKALLGNPPGQLAGDIFVLMVSLPYLMLLVSFIRRLIRAIHLYIRILCPSDNCSPEEKQMRLSLAAYVAQQCSAHRLKSPVLLLTDSHHIIMNLHHIWPTNTLVIEISRSVINLLNIEELKAAAAHEIGHIAQCPWKVSLLKQLSLLALFPNYYLTLCMDWARKELDADNFAVEATQDARSLKQALIKLSAAQCSYITLDVKSPCLNRRFYSFMGKAGRKMKLQFASIRFFFGDGLFGYVHPYLSERLQMIDATRTQEK